MTPSDDRENAGTSERLATVAEQFAARVAASPRNTAVSHGGRSLTYAEVGSRADALARRLRSLQAGPAAPVAVLVERGLELPGALLGILGAGRACLPLDQGNPPGRLAQLLGRARPGAVVAQRSLAPRLPPQPAPVFWLDDANAAPPGAPADPPPDATADLPPGDSANPPPAAAGGSPAAAAGSPACVLILPDGNRLPQAVAVDHRAVGACFAAIDRDLLPVAAGTRLVAVDRGCELAAIELLWALSRGCCAVLDADPAAGGPAPRQPAAAGPGTGRRAAAQGAAHGSDISEMGEKGEMGFSLFYFGNYAAGEAADHYRLVLEGAKFADRHGFEAIWTPERHFHEFGGLYPNPSVLSAAIAATTERLQIRAGSVVLPLHDPLRVAEEWALVDNLSGGRTGVSFASGWHANDFVLNPAAYQDRHEIMRRGIATVRRLWRGEALRLPGGAGGQVEVRIFPRPVQQELPIWVTAAGSPATFRLAGELGAGVLTHLLGQDAGDVAAKIQVYREAWRQAGHAPDGGRVTVMLHTFVGPSLGAVHAAVRGPLSAYLKTSFGLLRSLAESVGVHGDPAAMAPGELDLLVSRAYERYVAAGAGLIGTPDSCAETLLRLRQMGVDEVACLIDFGVAADQVLASLAHLDELRRRTAPAGLPGPGAGVIHRQITAPLARRLAAEPALAARLGGLGELLAGNAAALAGRF